MQMKLKSSRRSACSVNCACPGTEKESCASGTLLASLDPANEFADELAESPTWRASCRCLPPSLLRDTLSSKVCRYGSTVLELDRVVTREVVFFVVQLVLRLFE